MSLTCSLVIRCLNEAAHLPRLLDAMREQTLAPDEVVVVDSGSTDGTVRIALEGGAQVLHIPQREFSFGRSLNRGIAASRGAVALIASAHTYPTTRHWVEWMVSPFATPEVALVYGGQRGDQRTKFSEQQILRQWFPEQSCANQRHPFCNNANAAIRRSLWEQTPYDEDLPGLEDIRWAQGMLEQGHRLVYRHDAVVAHVHEESFLKIYRRYHREGMALRLISPLERMGFRNAMTLMATAIGSDLREAAATRRLVRATGSILAFRAAQYWAAYRGQAWHGAMTSVLRQRLYYPPGYRVPKEQAERTIAGTTPAHPVMRLAERHAE